MEAEAGDASVTELCVFPARRINLENVKSWLLRLLESHARRPTSRKLLVTSRFLSSRGQKTFLERPVGQGLSATKSPAGNPAESRPVGKLIKSFRLPDTLASRSISRVARAQSSSKRVLFGESAQKPMYTYIFIITLPSSRVVFLEIFTPSIESIEPRLFIERSRIYLATTLFSFSVIYGNGRIVACIFLSEKGVKRREKLLGSKTKPSKAKERENNGCSISRPIPLQSRFQTLFFPIFRFQNFQILFYSSPSSFLVHFHASRRWCAVVVEHDESAR